MTIGYLGPEGSFTYEAGYVYNKKEVLKPFTNISSIFDAVNGNLVDFGVVPIENSIHGMVNETTDNLKKYDLKIIKEIKLEIHHQFCSKNTDIKTIKKIYSKDVAYNQCRRFLKEWGLSGVEFLPVASTSKSAEIVSKEADCGAICSKMSAEIYKLNILCKNIEDSKQNETRFVVVSKKAVESAKNNKISIIVKLDNIPGSLFNFLKEFNDKNINLLKIESRPDVDDNNFNYWFYIEFGGNFKNDDIKNILKNEKVKYLGNY
jgi:chorismate mutase/prephenate dehydratase